MKKWILPIIVTLVAIWALTLPMPGLKENGKVALVVFLWAVAWWILRPIPEYLTSIAASAILILWKQPAGVALSGFNSPVWWMVVFATFLAGAITFSGLGRRIAFMTLNKLGTSLLRVIYATTMTNNLLAPFTPSNTARGGLMYGITEGISEAFGMKAGEHKGDHTLTLANMYINTFNTNMFLTAMGGNALFVGIIAQMTKHTITWNQWFIAAFVPMLPAALILPYIVYRMFPPKVTDLPGGRKFVQEQLKAMGPMTSAEKKTLVIMILTLVAWATEIWHHIPSTTTSFFMGVALLLPGIGPVDWKKLEKYIPWPMLIWLGFAMSLGTVVDKTGGFKWLVGNLFASSQWLQTVGFTPFIMIVITAIIFAHIFFSGMNSMGLIILPVVIQLATLKGFNPVTVGLIGALAVSTGAFFLPFNSAPNLIFYGSGRYEVKEQLRGAIPLAVLALFSLALALYVWWPLIHLV